MIPEKTKAAAPIPSVGAGGEQPIHKTTDYSIADDLGESNPLGQGYEEKLRQMRRMNDPMERCGRSGENKGQPPCP